MHIFGEGKKGVALLAHWRERTPFYERLSGQPEEDRQTILANWAQIKDSDGVTYLQ